MRLFDASDRRAGAWRPVHDGVMGGVSTGRVSDVDGAVRFAGELSLERGGGFASFRLDEPLPDLSGHDGLSLRVRGDGRVYKLSLRDGRSGDDVNWQARFATVDGEWIDASIAFTDLAPTWRGRAVPDAPPLDRARLVQLGLLLSDGRPGAYTLDLARIDAVTTTSS